MNRKTFFTHALIAFLTLLLAAPTATFAQGSGASGTFTQEELDQMIAPIALYPDSLLAQILVAATFPNEVVEADQWVRQNEGLSGDTLNAALDQKDWDLSVKALVPFPKVLDMMSDKLEWTQRLGDAFLAQQNDVMNTVQSLRAKAYAQGNLKSTDRQKVVVKGDSYVIEPVDPQIVYVPVYNPTVVYGSWWYPAYPPYAYNPYYPSYVYDPYYTVPGLVTAGVFGFAAGIAVGSAWNWGWGHWDWHHHDIYVNSHRDININHYNFRRGDIRTTNNLHRAVYQRRSGAAVRAGVTTTGRRGAGARPTPATVQRQLQQRPTKAQVRQGKQVQRGTQMRQGKQAQRGAQVRQGKQTQRGTQVRQGTQAQRGAQVRQGKPVQRGQQPAARSVRGQKPQRAPSMNAPRSGVRPDRSKVYRTSGRPMGAQGGKAYRSGGQPPRSGGGAAHGGRGGHGAGGPGDGGGRHKK